MPSAVPATCPECSRLLSAHAEAERIVTSLVEAQFETFPNEDRRLFSLLDDALATARRNRDSASEALHEHRRVHGFVW